LTVRSRCRPWYWASRASAQLCGVAPIDASSGVTVRRVRSKREIILALERYVARDLYRFLPRV
jgi:hypothetical protein